MRPIELIVVHCSDTDDSLDIGVDEIRRYHVQHNHWSDIGYHEVIRRSGKMEPGRPIARIGAHCKGSNLYSIGICLVGKDEFTPEQMSTLIARCRYYMGTYNIKPDQVFGHYELDKKGKTCPNFNPAPLRQELGA